MKTLAIILCHGRAMATIQRNHPFWLRHGMEINLLSPWDDPVTLLPHQHFHDHVSSHHGADNIARIQYALRRCAHKAPDYQRLSIWEYDSLCLSTDLPAVHDNEVAAMWMADAVTRTFTAGQYPHFPVFMGPSAAIALSRVAEETPQDAEGAYPDRYFGLITKNAGNAVKIKQLFPHAFTRNTISIPEDIEAMTKAVRAGANVVHGIKHAHVLASALNAYAERK